MTDSIKVATDVYIYTTLDDMDALKRGIRLGLEAAVSAVLINVDAASFPAGEVVDAIRALNPDIIAREAALDQLTREAQAQGMGYDND